MTLRTKSIVAVFGNTESGRFPLAMDMGRAISQCGQILLTGGTGASGLPLKVVAMVKEQAILGADSARSTGCVAPWIGVDRSGVVGSLTDRGGEAFLVQTDLDHRRNCLEACLCDAAVALEGKEGTTSEAVFCLSLGKPVVFVGNVWNKYGIGSSNGSVNFTLMVADAFGRVGKVPQADAPLDVMFNQSAVLAQLSAAATYRWFPEPSTPAEVLALATNALQWLQGSVSTSPPGDFPDI